LQQDAAQHHHVRLPAPHDRLGLVRLGDQPHRRRFHPGLAPDALRESDLVARRDRDAHLRHRAARRTVHHVHPAASQLPRQRDRLLHVPAALDPVRRRDAHEQRHRLWQRGPQCFHDLQEQAHPVGQAPAVAVGAQVGQRREERVQQVAVGGVNLEQVEPGRDGAQRGAAEVLDHLPDARLV
jgi:hypothetical protein